MARTSLRGIWGEHGAWAMALTSLGAGLVLAWPAHLASWLLLPSAVFLTGAKGLAQKARRSGSGYGMLLLFGAAGGAFALPGAMAAPLPFGVAALLLVPFAVLHVSFAASPRWTRALAVEVAGAFLVAMGGSLALAATRPGAIVDGAWAWAALGTLFLPGIFRARARRDPSLAIRLATSGAALAGLVFWGCLGLAGPMAPWGLAGASIFLGDLWAAWALPEWKVRTLGIFFATRYAVAALLMALAWRPLA